MALEFTLRNLKIIMNCPHCNSDNTYATRKPGWFFAVSLLLFGFPLFFAKKKYHCFDCGEDFSIK
jgi:transposase-like protein